jgi:peptidoglycan/LPS O-acetylase OafA/YrhL
MNPAVLDIERAVSAAAAHGSSELKHIAYLDGWRGLAIALVLQAHFFEIPGFNSGRLGVDVFFVLSGYLMSRILYVKRVPLSTFYKRRISRIMPVFVLFVAVVYGAAYYLHRDERHYWLYTLTFTRTYLPPAVNFWQTDAPISHIWSLNVEEHCYVFLSVITLVAFLKGREGPALILAGTISVAIHFFYEMFSSVMPVTSIVHTEAAASHLLISAGYYLVHKRLVPYVRPWMPLAALIAAVACYNKTIVPWWPRVVFSPYLLAFAVNHLAEAPRWFRSCLTFGPLCLLGIWSYSIYLWHAPFFTHQYFGPHGNVVSCLAGIGIGVISFYCYENPIRTWLNKTW